MLATQLSFRHELCTQARRELLLSVFRPMRSTNVEKEEMSRTSWNENLSLWVQVHCFPPRN